MAPKSTEAAPPPPPADPPESTDESSSGDQFDTAWARKTVKWVVDTIKTIDNRVGEGGLIGLAYSNLSDSFGYLEEAGVPPGVDSASYLARLATLKKFSKDAFIVEPSDPNSALAKYLTLRKETTPILDDLNPVLGTQYELGPAPGSQ